MLPCALSPPEEHTIVLSCPNEAHCGCTLSVAFSRSSALPMVVPVVTSLNNSAVSVAFSFPHGALVVADVNARDSVGNTATFVLVWTMDTLLPVTVWPPLAQFVNRSSLLLSFNCTKERLGCTFGYDLDGTGWKALGNSSSTSSNTSTAGVSLNEVDTRVVVSPPLATRSTNATFVFDAVVPAGSLGAAVVEVRVDGAALWTPAPVNTAYTLHGLAEGAHILEARAR